MVVGCSPWLGDVGCCWFGGLMQKAGEGGEETTEEGSTMRGPNSALSETGWSSGSSKTDLKTLT